MMSVQHWMGGVSILVSLSLDESESRAGVTIARLPTTDFVTRRFCSSSPGSNHIYGLKSDTSW